MQRAQLAVIRFLRVDHDGRPVDPGFGVDEGGEVDNSLPGLDFGRPIDPGYGLPSGWPHPGHGLPRPPHVWPPPFPPGPVDPEWGVDSGNVPGHPDHPIYLPVGPDHGLPPVAGHLPAQPDPPPGTIWPPLPPGLPPGKLAILVFVIGLGYRYFIVEIPVKPDQSLPGAGDGKPQPK